VGMLRLTMQYAVWDLDFKPLDSEQLTQNN
jgi:hypothetical protein